MKLPTASYRLQLNRNFRWAEASRVLDYLADLGVGAAYLSPILAAR